MMRKDLASVIINGESYEYLGKKITLSDLDQLSLKQINKYHELYRCMYEAKTSKAIKHSIIHLYTETISRLVKVHKEILIEELEKDFIIDREIKRIGGYLSYTFGPAMAILSTSVATYNAHYKETVDSQLTVSKQSVDS